MTDNNIIDFKSAPETQYWLTLSQALLLIMVADAEAKAAPALRSEMIEIIMAWTRGQRAPRHRAPLLVSLIEDEFKVRVP